MLQSSTQSYNKTLWLNPDIKKKKKKGIIFDSKNNYPTITTQSLFGFSWAVALLKDTLKAELILGVPMVFIILGQTDHSDLFQPISSEYMQNFSML